MGRRDIALWAQKINFCAAGGQSAIVAMRVAMQGRVEQQCVGEFMRPL